MSRATYLLRFDDICPGMNWDVWTEIESTLLQSGVRPILSVVPDNRDPKLNVSAPVSDFWERVRGWSDRGWTIALHGYQHTYVTGKSGLLKIKDQSEFAGLSAEIQAEKLRSGMEILRRENVRPTVWVAPGHSFDAVTVSLLPELGIRIISDGLSLYPYTTRDGMLWIPQQLWGFRDMPFGVWTVCNHHNSWSAGQVAEFKAGVSRFRGSISTVEEVAERFPSRRLSLIDRANAQLVLGRIHILGRVKQQLRAAAGRPA